MAVDSFNEHFIVSITGEVLKNEWRVNLVYGAVFIVISCHLTIIDIVILYSVSQSIGDVPVDDSKVNINVGNMNLCGGTW
jgi:hypothetical protein